jgi:hypothetical protein
VKKFRKKPVVIEAIQYDGSNGQEIAAWASEGRHPLSNQMVRYIQEAPGMYSLRVLTLEGELYARLDDWIIRGVKGEFYPCKPDIFEATYEAVGEK